MDRNLAIAIGIALLGHGALLASARLLPSPEEVPASEVHVSVWAESPSAPRAKDTIDVEFVAPEPAAVASRPEPLAGASAHDPTLPERERPLPTARENTRANTVARAPRPSASGISAPGAEPPSGVGTGPGLLSMRTGTNLGPSDPGALRDTPGRIGVPNLDPRTALGDGHGAAPSQGGTGRTDILESPALPRNDSVWVPTGGGTMRAKKQPFHAKIARDGTITFRDKPNVQIEGVQLSKTMGMPVLVGRFDVTDAVMKRLGDTLYPYRKHKLMEETREMRAAMARENLREELQTALATFNTHLRQIWHQSELSWPERRRALFLLWDEAAETGAAEVVRTAKAIRATILSFIRKNAPQGSELAFTEAEIAAFNRGRQSSARFAPYRKKD